MHSMIRNAGHLACFVWVAVAIGCGSNGNSEIDSTSASPNEGQGGSSTTQGGAGQGGAGNSGSSGTAGISGGTTGFGGTSGTAGTGGTAGTNGTAGTGGTGFVCNNPELAQGPVAIQSLDDTRLEGSPSWELLSDPQGEKAVLVFHWTSWPGGTVTGFRTLPLVMPFGTWPAGPLGPSFGTEPLQQPRPMVIGKGLGTNLSVLFSGLNETTGNKQLKIARNLEPTGGLLNEILVGNPVDGSMLLTPLSVTRAGPGSDTDFLFGYRSGGGEGGFSTSEVGGVGKSGNSQSFGLVGCGTGPLFMDAFPDVVPSVYGVIASTGKECCFCSSGDPPGNPTMLLSTFVGNITYKPKLIGDGPSPIRYLKVSKKSKGVWIVVGRKGGNGSGLDIELGSQDEKGNVQNPKYMEHVEDGGTFAAATYQDGLVLGWQEAVSDLESVIRVQVISSLGEIQGEGAFSVPFGQGKEPMALLANPSGGSMVVAWSHPNPPPSNPGLASEEQIHIARLTWGCEK
jgi:hypothetical protein